MKQKSLSKPRKKLPRLPAHKSYNAFIATLELEDIYLKELSAVYNTETICPAAKVTINMAARYRNYRPDIIKIYHDYFISIGDENSEEKDVEVKCVFVVTYKSPQRMTDTFFRVFKNLNLRVNTWPYMRELVHNTVRRMGIDAVIAPVYKVP